VMAGANRGIGLNLARALAARNWNVIASVRPQTMEIRDPSMEDVRIEAVASSILEIDLANQSTVASAAEKFGNQPLDVLINVAGLGPGPQMWYEHTSEILSQKFVVNTVGAFLTSKFFYPNLKMAKGAIINISSNKGSISENDGEDLAYRLSKVALNMMTVTMAREFEEHGDNIAVVAVNPGYVATRLTDYRSRDNMEECIAGLVEVVEGLDMAKTGTFINWNGETLPW
ncbi:hypothetical protein TRIATDRAFT_54996, partial [Trichoderma atroviride IMI 206040]